MHTMQTQNCMMTALPAAQIPRFRKIKMEEKKYESPKSNKKYNLLPELLHTQ